MGSEKSRVYHDEGVARKHLEKIRWPRGVQCPHCGLLGAHYELKGKKHRAGLWKCHGCRQQFSVTVGTAFASSKIALHKWIYAAAVLARSPNVTTHELQRIIGVTYKSAWFLRRRLRQALAEPTRDQSAAGGGAVGAGAIGAATIGAGPGA
jgi:transposase-like protein